MTRRRALTWIGSLAAVVLLAAVAVHTIRVGRGAALFSSCKNHSTFVAHALNDHASGIGWFPSNPNLPGDELLLTIPDARRAPGMNCHAGAPRQGQGGWQMVNAPFEAWGKILDGMRGSLIPVAWCGRPHPNGRRVVIALDPAFGNSARTLWDATAAGRAPPGAAGNPMMFSNRPLPESELAESLRKLNAILRANGYPETPIDVTPGKDYAAIAERLGGSP